MQRAWILSVLVLFVAAAVGCSSPEAKRARGGGPGGDVGNRGRVVQMHEGSWPFYKTPRLVRHGPPPDLEAARQAQRLSERAQ